MENDLSLIVRRVLLEAPTGGSGDSESGGFTPEERDQAMGAIFVTGAIVYYIVSALGLGAVALVGNLIESVVNDRDFQRREAIYRLQRGGQLPVRLINGGSQPVTLQRVFGGFLIPESFGNKDAPTVRGSSDVTGKYANAKTVGDFRGGKGKINIKSLLTGKPHPDSLVISMDGRKVAPKDYEVLTGDITSVSSNLDVDFYAAPFIPTHALVRTESGADLMIPVVYRRVGNEFIVVVADRMLRRADKKEAKRVKDL
jgi:hypothetical protein